MAKKKLHFAITIDAPKKKVWHTMLDDKTYRQWTDVFSPGSYYKGSWDKGSKIIFLGPDPETGKEMGMSATIAENRPYEFISIQHRGMIQGGREDTDSAEAKKWVPAFENYTFKEKNGSTEVSVDVDVIDEYIAMFSDLWPKALQKLKEVAER